MPSNKETYSFIAIFILSFKFYIFELNTILFSFYLYLFKLFHTKH